MLLSLLLLIPIRGIIYISSTESSKNLSLKIIAQITLIVNLIISVIIFIYRYKTYGVRYT